VTTAVGLCRVDDGSFALLDTAFPDVGAVIEQAGSLAVLAGCPVMDRLDPATPLLAPLGRPRAIWGVGLNYHSKAATTGRAVPTEPILYLAAPSSMAAPGAGVAIPVQQTSEFDYEGEIAVVVGRRLYQARP
jgi:2-keto-4-pentenoate hydratase/2-oxohepta-3-ene-1,7-dioic acid hydratase in catechol pathway